MKFVPGSTANSKPQKNTMDTLAVVLQQVASIVFLDVLWQVLFYLKKIGPQLGNVHICSYHVNCKLTCNKETTELTSRPC
jgi:hypothetical protein